MTYLSTRGQSPVVDAQSALRAGAAPDGGLYLPLSLPEFSPKNFDDTPELPRLAARLLAPFFAGTELADPLPQICGSAFNFPVPRVQLGETGPQVLELFHGPTGAFKDFGARFLFRCFDAIARTDDPITVLAATSGDTGGAVGCAAEGSRQAGAVILFPKGRISPFQEHQLCCWNDPVRALRVDGDFDACQALVKAAFADRDLSARHGLTSANSISIGRLLPQMSYWAHASLEIWRETGETPGLIIPTGNLGNAFAAVLARDCGLPIGPIHLATNANAALSDWHITGRYAARPSIATLANAMDVGAPSNFERLNLHDPEAIHRVHRVEDHDIQTRIRQTFEDEGYIACPHTATALEAYHRLPDAQREARPWLVGATADPYKFAETVEAVIGETPPLPPALAEVKQRPARVSDIPADLDALAEALNLQPA